MLVLISAVVKLQLKSRLKTATLYKVRNARIVFPSIKHYLLKCCDETGHISSQINKQRVVKLNLHIDLVALNVAIFSSALRRKDGLL